MNGATTRSEEQKQVRVKRDVASKTPET